MNAVAQSIGQSSELGFYVTGGTLQRDAPSYVTRRADTDLYASLCQARFCYVLTARQMGKSSLMVRIALRLREEGAVVAVLDLTAVGQNLTAEQWYAGLLNEIGQQLDLEDEFFDYWEEHPQFGPLQRWRNAIREILLARYAERVVIFIDEIDAIRNLPFSTDEFFAGLREFYNQRAEEPELQRLTFCLLGVATPSDLIWDTRTTPFNIGQRIELTDFTETEAAPLAQGLQGDARSSAQALRRILYWTGGHPYLTQRLCLALTKADFSSTSLTPRKVDDLCAELFLSARARELDDNLLFVRERLLRSEADRASLLDLYAKVLSRKRVRDDETNPLVSVLRLVGITRAESGVLQVRNRIYGRVFDRQWITANMPDAEWQRQRAAYRRGVWRTASVAAALLLLVAALAVTAMRGRNQADALRQVAEREKASAEQERNRAEAQARRAEDLNQKLTSALDATEQQRLLAEAARAEAEGQGQSNQRLLYAAQMNLAQRAWESDNIPRVLELLGQQQPALRSFEWDYLWSLCHSDRLTLRLPANTSLLKLSADGHALAAVGSDQSIWLWDVTAQRQQKRLKARGSQPKTLSFSPAGDQLAIAHENGLLTLWVVSNHAAPIAEHQMQIVPAKLAFAPNGKQLSIGGVDGSVWLWEPSAQNPPVFLGEHTHPITALAFSPNGQWLVSGSAGDAASLWQIAGRKKLRDLKGESEVISAVAFSADNQHLLTGGQEGKMCLWNVRSNQAPLVKSLPGGAVTALACAPNGTVYATGSSDQKIRLWDLQAESALLIRRGHTAPVTELAFSRDGQRLTTTGQDQVVKLWDLTDAPAPLAGKLAGQSALIALSPDGRWLATANAAQTPQLWDTATGKLIGTMIGAGHSETVRAVVFSRDGQWLATGGADSSVRLWNPFTQRLVARLPQADAVEALAFSTQRPWLAIGSNDGTVKLWDAARNREIITFKSAEATITSVAFTSDDRYLAAGDEQGHIRLWDVSQRQEISHYQGHDAAITALAFVPFSDLLATASRDGTTRLWHGPTRQAIAVFGESKEPVTAVTFTPDGKRMVTGHADAYVRFWDLATRQEVFNFWEHTGGINTLSFSADGKRFATASEDKRWLLFHASASQELSVQFQ
jgi:WD40 repeat protein